MTAEERTKYYEARQRYQWQCEDFKEEMIKYLSTYEPRMQKTEIRLVP